MSTRMRLARCVLVAYAVVCLIMAVPLLLFIGRAAQWIRWSFDPTEGKVLGTAFVAFAFASLLAARDPRRHRLVVQTDLVFTGMATLALIYRVFIQTALTSESAPVFLGLAAVFTVLLAATYPPAEKS
jgi:hypothetical protein